MRKINKPTQIASEVFTKCISKVRKKELKDRLKSCLPDIELAEDEFERLAEDSSLSAFKDELCSVRGVSIKEMEAVYTQRMVDKDSPGREIYDKLMNASTNWTCPICGQRKVSSLDHFLPKSMYPSLVVTPINLIPACDQCNKKKLDAAPISNEQTTLHPYFDDLGDERFLFAKVIHSIPPIINFYIDSPINWSKEKARRVEYHFETFELNLLYSVHAVDEILGQVYYWNELIEEDLRDELSKQAVSRAKHHPNSWQTAFYESMAQSEWFCKGGFHDFT